MSLCCYAVLLSSQTAGIRFMGYSRGGYEAKEKEAKVSSDNFNFTYLKWQVALGFR
jgi:hypothetical protein